MSASRGCCGTLIHNPEANSEMTLFMLQQSDVFSDDVTLHQNLSRLQLLCWTTLCFIAGASFTSMRGLMLHHL